MFNTLPAYDGPFSVGFVDIEQAPKEFEKPGVLLRVYYPSVTNSDNAFSGWLPDNWKYAKGYGHFLNIPAIAIAMFMYPVLCLTRKRAALRSRIADTAGKFPIAFFSHGLGGMRTTYSQLCGNLASKGVIVVALEHADQSAAFTSRLGGAIEIPHYHPKKEHLKEGEDVEDALLRVRRRQVQQRSDEVVGAITILKELNEGKLDSLLPFHEDSVKNAIFQLKDRIDFENAVIIGHSFGGATAIKVLDRSCFHFKCAVTLDPWMFSVQDCRVEKNVPMLNLQSQHFHWKTNLEQMKRLSQGKGYHKDSVFGHIRETSHQDASDVSLLFPFLMRWIKQSGPQDPKITHLVQDRIISDFLGKHIILNNNNIDGGSAKLVRSHALFGEESWTELSANL